MYDKDTFPSDEDEVEVVEMEFEDGTSCTCVIIAKFEIEDITYAALLPDDDDDADILVYRYEENGDDINLTEIDDEDEFNMVADALDEILDDLEFNSPDDL